MPTYPSEIRYAHGPGATPLGLAIDRGLIGQALAPLGVAVIPIEDGADGGDRPLLHGVRQHDAASAILARAAGGETRVIGLSRVDGSNAILALPGSGIHTPQDLKGRRIALPRRAEERFDLARAAALRALLAGLSAGGLGEHEVAWIDIDASARASDATHAIARRPAFVDEFRALVRGEVDAIHVAGPLGAEYALLGAAHVVVDTGLHPDPAIRAASGVPQPLVVDAALLAHAPDLAARLLATVIEVEAWAAGHPEATLDFIGRTAGASEQFVRAGHGAETFHRGLRTDLADDTVAAFAGFADFLFARGFLPAPVDVAGWIDRRPLAALDARGRVAA